jgi:hypothetical protein
MLNITRDDFVRRLCHLALVHGAVPPARKGGRDVLASDTRDFYRWFDAVVGNDHEKILYVATQTALLMFSNEKTDPWLATYFRASFMVGAGLVEFSAKS